MIKYMEFCKLRAIFQVSNTFKSISASNNSFLKHYGQVLFTNFRAEAAQSRILARPMDIS